MNSLQDRRAFVKLLTLAGFSLYLPGCQESDPQESPAQEGPADTLATDTVATLVEAVESQNVTYVWKADEAYEALRQGFNLRVQKHPAVIALCKNTAGVAEAIQFCAEGGHESGGQKWRP